MKRFGSLLLIFILCVSVASCSNKKETPVTVNREAVSNTDLESNSTPLVTEVVTSNPTSEPSEEVIAETPKVTKTPKVTTAPEETKSPKITKESEVSIKSVESIIVNLMSNTSQESIDSFLGGITTDIGFTFSPIVDRETDVDIECIGVNESNSNEYLAIVTLRQYGGIAKFSVTVGFNDTMLSSFSYFEI